MAAALQAVRDLVRLWRSEEPSAPEAEEHHGGRGLRVEPLHALVRPTLSGRDERDHRANWIKRRGTGTARAPPVGDGSKHALLDLGSRVDDDAVGLDEAPAVVREPRAVGVILVHQWVGEGRRRHRRKPRHVHRALHLLELDRHLLVERREAQEEREHPGAGGEVDVRGHGQLAGHVEQRRAEEVDDERGHRGRQAGHRRPDVRRVQLDQPGDELLDAAGVHRRLHCGEADETDVEAGGLLPAYVAVELGRDLLRGRWHEENGE